ncbi:hypothetical protein COLO4_10330 [Corchorus olitorius]|uniref:Pentacotripeptide-repeat region of PRORP domain-containing protein n=1 Tax=Corchorus olitorius TaxID=93759 RepID=A0A1R3K944_9ROSI|nr:hypothetical protein COLO4_10330 [Corchorus olitorius]
MVCQMMNSGFIELSSLEDPLSKAFVVLGFNPYAVRLRRDNYVGFSLAEFFDDLGNGLYLDTDVDEYDKKVAEVLDDSTRPDFNSLIMNECSSGNFKNAVRFVDEMIQWGQELSISVFFTFFKGLGTSRSHSRACSTLLEKMPKLINQLDQETMNMLIQGFCAKGLAYKGISLFYQMLQRDLKVNGETYTAVMKGLCKKEILSDLHSCWNVARNNKWLPSLEDCNAILKCLCHQDMLKEALELFEGLLVSHTQLKQDVCHIFLENLCTAGYTSIAHMLVEEFPRQGWILDHVAYSHLIRGLCHEKKFSAAIRVLDNMLAKDLVPCLDVALTLIPHLCRADKFEEAVTLGKIGLGDQSAFSLVQSALLEGFCMKVNYDDLIKKFCFYGRLNKAVDLLNIMLNRGNLPESTSYDSVIQGFCTCNKLSRAMDFHNEMLDQDLMPSINTWNMLVCKIARDGRTADAERLLISMVQLGQTPTREMYASVIDRYRSENNLKKASELMQMMQRSGYQPDFDTHWSLISNLSDSKDDSNSSQGFLSRLLSGSGFAWNNHSKTGQQ